MNWYKKAQAVKDRPVEYYTDVGHYYGGHGGEYTEEMDKDDRKVALWQSDITGSKFEVKEFDLYEEATHDDDFSATDEYGNDIGNATMYQGRYDPIKNMVSINMPVDPNNLTRIVNSDEIPNRLIKQLERAFPGSSMYAFEYGSPPTPVA